MARTDLDGYVSPLAGRYASREMVEIWSARRKFTTWRRIWLAVAEAQHEVTEDWPTPLVTKEQVEELRANLEVTDEDMDRAERYEAELRHDVMAHVKAWGDRCPKAKGIIHLGMTSQDVNDNCELLLIAEANARIRRGAQRLMKAMGEAAGRYAEVPTLGLTHYQPAQPTTVGRRLAQGAYDLSLAMGEDRSQRLRGLRGATGTQASFLQLLGGDATLVDELEVRWHKRFVNLAGDASELNGCTHRLTSQTYPRVFDAQVVSCLASIAAVLHKTATDIRLLCNRKELDEPFESRQIGSSAMPYKRNPMRCERVCGLARFVMNLVGNAYETAATQWLERTLDDSSNRRLVLPEAFLATDACLNIMLNVVRGLVVHEAQVRKNLMAELPFLATENILMEAVKAGGDRQELHEAIREHAQHVAWRIKQEGAENDLIERLCNDPCFDAVKDRLTEGDLLDPMKYVGRAVEQTKRFIKEVVDPLREEGEDEQETPELRV